MKRFAISMLFLGALAMILSARPIAAQVSVSISIGGFYDELAPYGRWIDCRYGQCWVPGGVAAGWQPYSNGQWIYTEYGWTWMSDDPWGGNPYHYGTWTYLNRYGWSWVPGTVWAPAWVTWSYGSNFVGWAPLPPTIVFGASGYSGRAIVVNPSQYVFVPTNRFVGSNVASVRVSAQQNATIFRHTTHVTRFGVSGGIVRNTAIPVATIQHAAGVTIETRSIRDARATPRSIAAGSTGKSRHVAIVAPAREVKATAAARSRAGSQSTAPSKQKGRKPDVQREPGRAKPQRQERMAPKPQEASPGKSNGQAATRAPAHSRKEAPKKPGRAMAPAPQSRHDAAPAQPRQQPPARVEANPSAGRAPARAGKPASPKQGSKSKKPVKQEKDDKPH
jgi:hypothetical protein